jgi:hypothetical protein
MDPPRSLEPLNPYLYFVFPRTAGTPVGKNEAGLFFQGVGHDAF